MAASAALAAALLLAPPAAAAPSARATATIVGCHDDQVILAVAIRGKGVGRSELRVYYGVAGLFQGPIRKKEASLGRRGSGLGSEDFTRLRADVYLGFVRYRFVRGRRTILRGVVRTTSAKVGRRRGRAFCALLVGRRPEDRIPPEVFISPQPGSLWVRAPLEGTFTATDDFSGVAEVVYSVNGGPLQSGRRFTLTGDGPQTVTYAARDVAGNVSPPKQATYLVDAAAPSAPFITAPGAGAVLGDTTPAISWSESSDSASGVQSYTVIVTNSGGGVVFSQTLPAGTLSTTVDPLPDDDYTVQVIAADGATPEPFTAGSSRQFTVDHDIYANAFTGGCESWQPTPPWDCTQGDLRSANPARPGTYDTSKSIPLGLGGSFTLSFTYDFLEGTAGANDQAVVLLGGTSVLSLTDTAAGSFSHTFASNQSAIDLLFRHDLSAAGSGDAYFKVDNISIVRN